MSNINEPSTTNAQMSPYQQDHTAPTSVPQEGQTGAASGTASGTEAGADHAPAPPAAGLDPKRSLKEQVGATGTSDVSFKDKVNANAKIIAGKVFGKDHEKEHGERILSGEGQNAPQ